MRRSCSTTRTASTSLPLDQKILVWHLYQAALAGRDIYYDQRYRHALEMREILEEILTHIRRAIACRPSLAEIRRYTKLFWINSGPHNNITARKFVLKCTPRRAARRGRDRRARRRASFRARPGETLDALLERLRRRVLRSGRRSAW